MSDTPQFERDRAYHRIVEQIFGPGFDRTTPLSERKLAETFGIGRMPVREALRQLEQEGVVEVRPARGTFVRRLEPADIADVYRVREALECLVARSAAGRDDQAGLAAIGTKLKIMVRDPDAFTAAEIDDAGTEFHEALVQVAANEALSETLRLFRTRFRLAFHLPRYFSDRIMQETLREHLAIHEAVSRQDAAAAEELMRDHLKRGLALRLRLEADTSGPTPARAAPKNAAGPNDDNSGMETT